MSDTSKSAYPFSFHPGHGFGAAQSVAEGMSLREYLAAHCPITTREAFDLWTSTNRFSDLREAKERQGFLEWFAILRFEYADAILAAAGAGNEDASALAERVRELEEALVPSYSGLLVLRTMLRKEKLEGGAKVADEIIADLVKLHAALPALSALRAQSPSVPSSSEQSYDPEKFGGKASGLPTALLEEELARLRSKWDDMRNSDEELGGGSPGEWIAERMDEIDAELRHRCNINVAFDAMDYEYVKRTYGVNPVVGHRVRHHVAGYGIGTICSENKSMSHRVIVKFDNGRRGPCHPTEMDYLGKGDQ